jgi:hypothetical protein
LANGVGIGNRENENKKIKCEMIVKKLLLLNFSITKYAIIDL